MLAKQPRAVTTDTKRVVIDVPAVMRTRVRCEFGCMVWNSTPDGFKPHAHTLRDDGGLAFEFGGY